MDKFVIGRRADGAAGDVNTIDNTTNANITGSTLDATGTLTVDTKENLNFKVQRHGNSDLLVDENGFVVGVAKDSQRSQTSATATAPTGKKRDGHIEKVNEDRFNPDGELISSSDFEQTIFTDPKWIAEMIAAIDEYDQFCRKLGLPSTVLPRLENATERARRRERVNYWRRRRGLDRRDGRR